MTTGAVAGLLAGGLAWNAEQSGQPERPDRSWVTRPELEDHTTIPGADDRLREAAAAMDESPLYVDPALAYLLPPEDRTAVVAALEAGPPTFVVLMPFTGHDGMGGNADAAVLVLSDEVGRDGQYVIIDERRQAASVDRHGDAIRLSSVSIYDGPLGSVLPRVFHEHRTPWTPEESHVG